MNLVVNGHLTALSKVIFCGEVLIHQSLQLEASMEENASFTVLHVKMVFRE